MRLALTGLVALTLTSGCIRLEYDALPAAADASQATDASVADAAVADAAPKVDAAIGGKGGHAPAGAAGHVTYAGGVGGSAGSAGAGAQDAGIDISQTLGDTGLHVSDILGFYSGDWGDMVLRKEGDEIWGVYPHDSGTIVGQITSDGVFVGWWTQLPSRAGTDAGEVEFRWSKTTSAVIALDGRWRYGTVGAWLENWDIDLVTDRAAPTDLTDRFASPNDFIRHP